VGTGVCFCFRFLVFILFCFWLHVLD